MSQTKYYVYLNESVQGPYDLSEIAGMGLDEQTQICPEGTADWVSLKAVASDPLSNFVSSSAGMKSDMPSQVGKYTVLSELGQGGMGAVYLAVDKALNRKVAVKELKVDEHKKKDPDAYAVTIKRFKREAQILAQLNHKNIVSVYDVIEQNDNQYIIMEYLSGKDLEQIVEAAGGSITFDQAASIIADTCLALDYIHQRNIIHRDIKPSNIFILDDGVVKLTDFGVTKDLNSMTMTVDGSLVGTIAYASPEQDSRELDGRSDIFSLGVVLYEIVTGQKPFTGDTIASVLLKIATKEPIKPTEINPKIHKMLENIISKAMAKNPSKRYQSAMEMNNDLNDYRSALASNNTSQLSGMKSTDMFSSSTSVKQVDYNVKKVGTGSLQPKTLQNTPSNQPATSNQPINQAPKIGTITQSGNRKIQDTNFDMPNPLVQETPIIDTNSSNQIVNRIDQLINNPVQSDETINTYAAELSKGSTADLQEEMANIFESNSTLVDTPPTKETATPIKEEKKLETSKSKSASSEQKDKENRENLLKIIIPTVFGIISLLLMLVGIINTIDFIMLIVILIVSCIDFFSKQVIKPISYFITLIGSYVGWFIAKSYMGFMESTKLSNAMFYLLDFSILLISLIIFFFILKIADNLSANKNKTLRPIGGIIKSLVLILGFIFTINSSSMVESGFFQKQFEKSKFVDLAGIPVSNFKAGKKINVSFGKPTPSAKINNNKPNNVPNNKKENK
ncbi:MAG: protein kinase [Candidatus Sericytochromatia bacterium]